MPRSKKSSKKVAGGSSGHKVVDLTEDDEFQSMMKEAMEDHGLPNNNNTVGGANSSNSSSSRGGFRTMWIVLGFVGIAILFMLATDSEEIQHVEGMDMDGNFGVHTVKKPNNNINNYHDNISNNVPADIPVAAPEPAAAAASEPAPEPVPASVPASEPAAATTTAAGSENRFTYNRRGQPMSDADKKAMQDKYGTWTLVDDKERPMNDFYQAYPNRDVPRDKFPSNAWQVDKAYLSKFLPEALAMVKRTQEGILAEYGKTEDYGTMEERMAMFNITMYSDELKDVRFPKYVATENAGWTTPRSWDGLKRRLLHAIMTEDKWVFAMGGHSSAAGHGNIFTQSYTLQIQWILEAVFARLGVKHEARNFGMGGLGTIHNGMATGSMYGPDVDLLFWDSGMTEKEGEALDTFARQAVLSGIKVPAVWGLFPTAFAKIHDEGELDMGGLGQGKAGIPEGISEEQIEKMPWALQYVQCNSEMSQICRAKEYIGHCWIDRDDYTPELQQQAEPGGRASWHPGNRKHQVKGRLFTMIILQALEEALKMWNEAPDYALPDDSWHVTSYYENTRTKMLAMNKEESPCWKYEERAELGFLCDTPIKARSVFTPRAYPAVSSFVELMPKEMRDQIPEPEKNVYNPPDVFNPDLHPPAGAVDVLNIVEAGVDFKSTLNPDYSDFYTKPKFPNPPKIPVGKAFSAAVKAGDDSCDGSIYSFCGRGPTNNCLLYAHNDGRIGLRFCSLSGWVVFNVPDVKNGIIFIKYESWHFPEEAPAPADWTTINGERRRLGSGLAEEEYDNEDYFWTDDDDGVGGYYWNKTSTSSTSLGKNLRSRRELKRQPPPFCDEFKFEYAIDGKITTLNLEQWQEKRKQVQRVVETQLLLNDPSYTGGQEKEVEVAVRITGCAHVKVFSLNHIYWS